MRVTTPVTGFTGTVVGVTFTNGAGETDDPQALAYFTRHGYTLGGGKTDKPEPVETDPEPDVLDDDTAADEENPVVMPAGNASKQAWSDYALASGFSEDEIEGLDRNELRDLVAD